MPFIAAFLLGDPAHATVAGRYDLGAAVVAGELAVWPVVDTRAAAARPAGEHALLAEALAAKTLAITEQDAGGSVPTLSARNTGTRPVLLLAGDVVTGGKQDRVVVADTIVPTGGAPVDIGVNCVESGRWEASGGLSFGFGGRAEVELRKTVQLEQDQGATWSKVAEITAKKGQSTGATNALAPTTGTYRASLQQDAVTTKRDALVDALRPKLDGTAGLVGLVVAVDGELVGAELFGWPALYERAEEQLLRGLALDAVSDTADERSSLPGHAEAEAFLADALAGARSEAEPTADAVRSKVEGARVEGASLSTGDGEVLHLDVYTK